MVFLGASMKRGRFGNTEVVYYGTPSDDEGAPSPKKHDSPDVRDLCMRYRNSIDRREAYEHVLSTINRMKSGEPPSGPGEHFEEAGSIVGTLDPLAEALNPCDDMRSHVSAILGAVNKIPDEDRAREGRDLVRSARFGPLHVMTTADLDAQNNATVDILNKIVSIELLREQAIAKFINSRGERVVMDAIACLLKNAGGEHAVWPPGQTLEMKFINEVAGKSNLPASRFYKLDKTNALEYSDVKMGRMFQTLQVPLWVETAMEGMGPSLRAAVTNSINMLKYRTPTLKWRALVPTIPEVDFDHYVSPEEPVPAPKQVYLSKKRIEIPQNTPFRPSSWDKTPAPKYNEGQIHKYNFTTPTKSRFGPRGAAEYDAANDVNRSSFQTGDARVARQKPKVAFDQRVWDAAGKYYDMSLLELELEGMVPIANAINDPRGSLANIPAPLIHANSNDADTITMSILGEASNADGSLHKITQLIAVLALECAWISGVVPAIKNTLDDLKVAITFPKDKILSKLPSIHAKLLELDGPIRTAIAAFPAELANYDFITKCVLWCSARVFNDLLAENMKNANKANKAKALFDAAKEIADRLGPSGNSVHRNGLDRPEFLDHQEIEPSYTFAEKDDSKSVSVYMFLIAGGCTRDRIQKIIQSIVQHELVGIMEAYGQVNTDVWSSEILESMVDGANAYARAQKCDPISYWLFYSTRRGRMANDFDDEDAEESDLSGMGRPVSGNHARLKDAIEQLRGALVTMARSSMLRSSKIYCEVLTKRMEFAMNLNMPRILLEPYVQYYKELVSLEMRMFELQTPRVAETSQNR